jgi:general secretion pathway protein E
MDRPFLSILTDEGVRRIPLGDETVTIGRAEENTIVIFDLQASRFHCQICKGMDGRWMVKDLESRNGTKLNGRRIHDETPFGKGDVVRIGTTEIRLLLAAAEPLPPPGPIGAPIPATAPATPQDPAPVAPFTSVSHPLDPPTALTPYTAPPGKFTPHLRGSPVALSPVFKPAGGLAKPNPPASSADPRSPTLVPLSRNGPQDKLDELEVVGETEEEVVDLAPFVAKNEGELLRVEVEPGRRAAEETKLAIPALVDEFMTMRDLAQPLPGAPLLVEDLALLDSRGHLVGPETPGEAWKQCAEALPVLRQALVLAARAQAGELHLEPRSEGYHLRLRMNGSMADGCRVGKSMGTKIVALVKLLCEIDPTSRNIVQEGRFSSQTPAKRIECRVSFTPALVGQKLVIRRMDPSHAPAHIPDLQMPAWLEEETRRALLSDTGLVLVGGPASSGRTTTLYALLRDVGVSSRNVTAIEDPVEAEVDGVTQVLVDAEQGHTYPALLRSLLRQDPDVVMVGELRDAETARTAAQASTTGRLILTSLYARDAISTLARLCEWNIEPYVLSSTLQLVIAQRLVRQLCPSCKKPIQPTPEQLSRMGNAGEGVAQIFAPVGCPACLKTGFWGRRAFFEALVLTDDLRDAILKGSTPRELEKALSGADFERLPQAGYRLVAQGISPIEEVERAIGPQPRKQS